MDIPLRKDNLMRISQLCSTYKSRFCRANLFIYVFAVRSPSLIASLFVIPKILTSASLDTAVIDSQEP